jgi:hypothetical protein
MPPVKGKSKCRFCDRYTTSESKFKTACVDCYDWCAFMELSKCTSCLDILPWEDFAHRDKSLFGLFAKCKKCNNEAAETWRLEDKTFKERKRTCKMCNSETIAAEQRCEACVQKCQESQTTKCCNCELIKPWNQFRTDQKGFLGLTSRCYPCLQLYETTRSEEKNRFISQIFGGCSSRNKRTKGPNRPEFIICDITMDFLLELWEKQQGIVKNFTCLQKPYFRSGKCFYSGLPMTTKPYSDWKASLERLDPSTGYMQNNVAFVCLEFNSSTQMSRAKVKQIQQMIHSDDVCITTQSLDQLYLQEQRSNQSKINKQDNQIECRYCNVWLDANCFLKSPYRGCKNCRSERRKDFRQTLLGRLHQIIDCNIFFIFCTKFTPRTKIFSGCKSNTKRRNLRRRNHDYSISFDYIVSLLKQQSGRCFYSNVSAFLKSQTCNIEKVQIPLQFSGNDWVLSLERLDVNRGYIIDNVKFVCTEFNTADFTSVAQHDIEGSGGWSR